MLSEGLVAYPPVIAALAGDTLLALVLAIGFSVLGAVLLPRIWRDELPRWPKKPPAWWLWGGALYRGWVRMHVVAVLDVWVVSLSLVVLVLTPASATGAFARPYWVVVPLLAMIGLCIFAMLGVVLFNQPKFLVAPYRRREPGAVTEWLS